MLAWSLTGDTPPTPKIFAAEIGPTHISFSGEFPTVSASPVSPARVSRLSRSFEELRAATEQPGCGTISPKWFRRASFPKLFIFQNALLNFAHTRRATSPPPHPPPGGGGLPDFGLGLRAAVPDPTPQRERLSPGNQYTGPLPRVSDPSVRKTNSWSCFDR